MRTRSTLTTTFYGGKNGMKRRITAIMGTEKKHESIVLWAVVLLLVSCLGMAFAVDAEPKGVLDQNTIAYITPH